MSIYTDWSDSQLDREIARRLKVTPINKRWSTDLNDAIELTDTIPAEVVIQCHAGTSEDGIWQAWLGMPSVPQANASTPARAICETWLVWNDSQPAPK